MEENKAALAQKKAERQERRAANVPGEIEPLSDAGIMEEVREIFKKLDKNIDDQLSLEEADGFIKEWCQRLGLSTEEAQVMSTFDDIDLNKDGFLSKDELFKFLKDQRSLHSELFEAASVEALEQNEVSTGQAAEVEPTPAENA